MTNPDEDSADVEAARQGDGDAYGRIIRRYQGEISAQMWRFTRDPATLADLVQEVFLNAYRGLNSYQGRAPFAHWLHKIAVRVGYGHWRRQAAQPLMYDEDALRLIAEEPREKVAAEADDAASGVPSPLIAAPQPQAAPRSRCALSLVLSH